MLPVFQVPDLTDHHDVRILAQERAQGGGEGHPDIRSDQHLVDARQIVFDRILGRHDVDLVRVDPAQGAVQGRRLTGTGGTRDEDHAIGLRYRVEEVLL